MKILQRMGFVLDANDIGIRVKMGRDRVVTMKFYGTAGNAPIIELRLDEETAIGLAGLLVRVIE